MAPLLKTCSLLLLLLLSCFSCLSSGKVERLNNGMNPADYEHQEFQVGAVVRNVRKLLLVGVDAVLDYDYGGPNPRHDPRRGKPPGGKT